jgi:hypothetical protein
MHFFYKTELGFNLNINLNLRSKILKSKLLKILVVYFAFTIPFLGILDLITSNQSKTVQIAEAMSFKSGWKNTIYSVSPTLNSTLVNENVADSKSDPEVNPEVKSEPHSDPKFSYINPYLDYPNLSVEFQKNPENIKKLVQRIETYIRQNSSRESSDKWIGSLVSAEFYLETAIKYHVPIEQMLAVARSESRFGTDCYNSSGGITRICTYKNIFSIGLTESSSIGFESWEAGVEAFGRLYQNRKNRGYSDCDIWSIYNPNGNYCGKILELASKISIELNKN